MTLRNDSRGALIGGVLLIGLGLLFLLAQFFDFNAWRFLWPLAVLGFGALFFAGMVAGGKSSAGLAIPGSIIIMIGLLLLYQNFTSHWSSWSYGWTFIIVAIGIGLFIMGLWEGNEQRRREGLRVAGVGFILFVVFGAFFELGGWFFGDRSAGQFVFPVLLIGVGLYLLVTRLWPGRVAPRDESPTIPPPSENA
jgi:hypothetical protein